MHISNSHLSGKLLHRTSMADLSSSHNKSHWALSLTLNSSLVSLSFRPELSLNPCSLISKTLSNELHGRPSQAHPLTSTLPPQAASLHQTLTEPSPNLSSLSLIFETLLGRASLELPRSPISNHQPPWRVVRLLSASRPNPSFGGLLMVGLGEFCKGFSLCWIVNYVLVW